MSRVELIKDHAQTLRMLQQLYHLIMMAELNGRLKTNQADHDVISVTRFHIELTKAKLAEKGISIIDI